MIDEAYVDFGAETAIPLVASPPEPSGRSNHVQVAGAGRPAGRLCDRRRRLIEALTRVKDSFNSYPLGRPAQAGAIASLEDEAWFQESRARVIEGRERLNRGLLRLGFDVLPSAANFVFARHPAHEGAPCRSTAPARSHRPPFSAARITDYLRITVGTDEQIDRLLSELSRDWARAWAADTVARYRAMLHLHVVSRE